MPAAPAFNPADPFADLAGGKPAPTPKAAQPKADAPPPPAPSMSDAYQEASDLVAGAVQNVANVVGEGWHETGVAGRQLVSDVGGSHMLTDPMGVEHGKAVTNAVLYARAHPNDQAARQRAADLLHEYADQVRAGTRLPMDILQMGGAPFAGIGGEAGAASAQASAPVIEKMTGGKMTADPEKQGNIIMMAMPFLQEAGEARAAAAFSRSAGISVPAARLILEQAAKVKAGTEAAAVANRAARRILSQKPGGGKVTRAKVAEATAEHRAAGVEPTFLDVIGQSGQRLVRSAGVKTGEAGEKLAQHRQSVRSGLSGKAVERARDLSPYTDSLDTRYAQIEAHRDNLADDEFREPYATRLHTDDYFFTIINHPVMDSAVDDAEFTASTRMVINPKETNPEVIAKAAEARQQYRDIGEMKRYIAEYRQWQFKMQEWTKNLSGKQPTPPEFPEVSAGAVDRIRIQAQKKLSGMIKTGENPGLVGGFTRIVNDLDGYLDGVPQLSEARATYRGLSQQMEMLEWKKNINEMNEQDFAKVWGELPHASQLALRHHVAQTLADEMAQSAKGAQSEADVFGTGYYAQANLRLMFGEDVADSYLRANHLLVSQLKAASFVDPTLRSPTAGIIHDMNETGAMAGLDLVMGHHLKAAHRVAGWLTRNLTGMTEAEAIQIAEWAVSQRKVEDVMATILSAAEGKAGGRFVPGWLKGFVPVALSPEVRTLIASYSATNPIANATRGQAGGPAAPGKPQTPVAFDPTDPFKDIAEGGAVGAGAPADTAPAAPAAAPAAGQPPASGDTGDMIGPPGDQVSRSDAATYTGLQGDDLKAALDVMGVESGGKPGKLDPAAYNPAGGGEGARGIMQARGDRQIGLGDTTADQLKHVGAELKEARFSEVLPELKAAPTMIDKYDVWLRRYEGLERGGPDYMTDLDKLVGPEEAQEYVTRHGGKVNRQRPRGRGEGGIAGGGQGLESLAGSIAPAESVEMAIP